MGYLENISREKIACASENTGFTINSDIARKEEGSLSVIESKD